MGCSHRPAVIPLGQEFSPRTSPVTELFRTPLYDLVAPTARMTAFSGWEMAVQFSGISQEHQAVRSGAGMFDISHMGKFCLTGDVLAQIQLLVPSDLSRLQPGQAQYTVLLNPEGGIIDDLIFYFQGGEPGRERWVVIVNAATCAKDKAWMLAHVDQSKVEFADRSLSQVLLAVQGPQAVDYLQALVSDDLSKIPAFGHCQSQLASPINASAFLARTGYTGEDGFEVMLAPEPGCLLWQTLLAAGVVPCGLGARDTLRLEAAMALYGQDINDAISPLEAGLGWLVHWDQGEFIGRSALAVQKAQGVTQRLVGLQMTGRNIARHDYPILFEGQRVGEVTSGTLSPTLGYPVALAYVPTALAQVGQVLEVSIRGQVHPGTVVKRPFYRSAKATSQ
jgi:aminomethyltransferase